MGGIGGPELLIVFLVVLLVFGPKKIPEVARGLGRVIGNVRRLSVELQRDLNFSEALEEKDSPHLGRPGPGPSAPPSPSPPTPPAADDEPGPTPRQ